MLRDEGVRGYLEEGFTVYTLTLGKGWKEEPRGPMEGPQ